MAEVKAAVAASLVKKLVIRMTFEEHGDAGFLGMEEGEIVLPMDGMSSKESEELVLGMREKIKETIEGFEAMRTLVRLASKK